VSASVVAISLALFVLVYCVVFSIGVLYIARMLRKGPKIAPAEPEPLPNRPLSAGQVTKEDLA
jgi:cytochrome d ubiquinol oxidase subunit I